MASIEYVLPMLSERDIGSSEKTAQVVGLYSTFASLLESDDFKVLKAGVHHITTQSEPRARKEACAVREIDGDSDDDDDDDEEYNPVLPHCDNNITCDFSAQLERVKQLGKAEFTTLMRETDAAIYKRYTDAVAALENAGLSTNPQLQFPQRVLQAVDAQLTLRANAHVLGPILLQFDTGSSTPAEVVSCAVAWALRGLCNGDFPGIADIFAPLQGCYLGEQTSTGLAAALAEKGGHNKVQNTHPDLLSNKVASIAAESFVAHFGGNADGAEDKFVGAGPDWPIRPTTFVNNRLVDHLEERHRYTSPPEHERKVEAMNIAIKGLFLDEVKAVFADVVKENVPELVYNCWTYMLLGLVGIVEKEIGDARETVLAKTMGRLVIRRGRKSRADDGGFNTCRG